MKINSKTTYWGIIIGLIIWQILLTFQGLDLADTGFQLTAFRFIFEDPYSVQYSMMFWLSDVFGSLWMHLCPWGGLYWARIAWVLAITLTLLVYLNMLKKILHEWEALIGLAVTLIFILRGGPECLNYDILTTFSYSLVIFFLYDGLLRNKSLTLFISGLILGAAIFFKLSNVTGLFFLILIPFYDYINTKNIRLLLQKCFWWILGLVIGSGSIIFLIYRVGHWKQFTENLHFVSQMGSDTDASHGFIPMLNSYLLGYFNAIIMVLVASAIVIIYHSSRQRFSFLRSQKISFFLLILISLLTFLLGILFKEAFWSKIRYLFIGLMIIQALLLVMDKHQSKQLRLLSIAGIILLVVAPLGSDSGLEKSVWGMWILGPILISHFFQSLSCKITHVQFSDVSHLFLKRSFINILLISSVIYAWQNTYFDKESRLKKMSPIDHPKMNCIYTSQKRAAVMNELIHDAFPLFTEKEYLLSFIEIPLLNYLSDKKPFISTSWPKLYYSPAMFKEKLDEALQKRQKLPAIIRQKQNTTIYDWPSTYEIAYLNYPATLSKWSEHGKILNEFIHQNHYFVVWENEMFQLLITRD